MLTTVMAFWRAHKCRTRVVATLAPFVARWRRDGGTDADLGTPAALGFLTTLITAVAERDVGALQSNALGTLQAGVWRQLTGLPADDLGERVVALSIREDPGFARGCTAALLFEAARARLREAGSDGLGAVGGDDSAVAASPQTGADADLSALWSRSIGGETPAAPGMSGIF